MQEAFVPMRIEAAATPLTMPAGRLPRGLSKQAVGRQPSAGVLSLPLPLLLLPVPVPQLR